MQKPHSLKMWFFYLCFLWIPVAVGNPTKVNRRYKGARLEMEIDVHTSSCDNAGTDSDLIPEFGYVNLKNKLIYSLFVKPVKGDHGDNFERSNSHYFTYTVPTAEFNEMERNCYNEAIWPVWHQTVYEDCFHTNLLYIKMYEVGKKPDWKPEKIEVVFWFTLKTGVLLPPHTTNFLFRPSCDHDWVHGSGEHYICRDKIDEWKEYLNPAVGHRKGSTYTCERHGRKLRKSTDKF
uniref:C-type lectin domain-containing protein n=1 Tax=Steinernema glaseri TaxID=37863 RepID=A0A1I7ZJ14_9BILA